MNITYIHQYFVTPNNPGGVRSYEVAKQLVSMGHTVNMITSDRSLNNNSGWYNTVEDGIEVHWLPVQYSNTFNFFQRIKAFIEFSVKASFRAAAFKADVIFATSTPLSIGIPGVYASYKQSAPLVFEVRDLWPAVPISIGVINNPTLIWLSKKFESYIYRQSEAVIVLSPGMKNGVVKSGCLKSKVSVIPNFSDIGFFLEKNKGDKTGRWKFNSPLIVYTGTFGMINGLRYLVELAKELHEIQSNVTILLVGDGKENDEITKLAQHYKVLNNNLFIKKPIKKSELPWLLSIADMSCNIVIDNKDVWNNSANKFFDGLASGRPILINSGGWQADLIEEFNTGIVTFGLSLSEAAEKITYLLNNKEWVEKTGINALQLAKTYFDKGNLIGELERVLVEASNKNGTAAHKYGLKL
jgi:glycosyltransferase involved in cell wall biosynthesis